MRERVEQVDPPQPQYWIRDLEVDILELSGPSSHRPDRQVWVYPQAENYLKSDFLEKILVCLSEIFFNGASRQHLKHLNCKIYMH